MPRDVNELRPSGIKRKIMHSIEQLNTQDTTLIDRIVGYFPHGAKIIKIGYMVHTTAGSANASSTSLNIGVASGGDTIIDGFPLVDSEAIGHYTDMTDTPGTNGGLKVIPPGSTVFVEHVTADVDGGKLSVVIEYEDENN